CHHSQFEPPVVRLRLREKLDAAEDLADIRGQHARDLATEEDLAVHLDGRPHAARTDVLDPRHDVRSAAQPALCGPIGVGDYPGIEACAGHHRETLAVDRTRVYPAPVAMQPDLNRRGEIGWH